MKVKVLIAQSRLQPHTVISINIFKFPEDMLYFLFQKHICASMAAQLVKNRPEMLETWV